MNEELKWEWIQPDYIRRLRTPWGWLVQVYEHVVHDCHQYGQGMEVGWDFRTSITFVFDPFHWWKP